MDTDGKEPENIVFEEGEDFFDWLARRYVKDLPQEQQDEMLAKWKERRDASGADG